MLNAGDRVRVPAPNGEGKLLADLLARLDPDEAIEVSPGVRRDGWRVRYAEGELEGTTGKVRDRDIEPV